MVNQAQDQAPEEGLIYSGLVGNGIEPLIKSFLSKFPRRLEEMEVALDKEEWKNLVQLAHSIRGASACYGYPVIAEQAATLEKMANEKSSTADFRQNLSKLRELFERAKNAL